MARPLDEVKKQRILRWAFVYFDRQGFDGTKVKAIAESAGVAPGTIYTYFKDKEELFSSALEETWERFARTVQKRLSLENRSKQNVNHLVDVGFYILHRVSPLLKRIYSDNKQQQLNNTIETITGYLEKLVDNNTFEMGSRLPESRKERRFFLKMFVSGVLFSVSTSAPTQLHGLIEDLKRGFKNGFIHVL